MLTINDIMYINRDVSYIESTLQSHYILFPESFQCYINLTSNVWYIKNIIQLI